VSAGCGIALLLSYFMCGFSNLTRHVSVSHAAAAADGFLNHLKL